MSDIDPITQRIWDRIKTYLVLNKTISVNQTIDVLEAANFHISHNTIRRSLNILVDGKYLIKEKGISRIPDLYKLYINEQNNNFFELHNAFIDEMQATIEAAQKFIDNCSEAEGAIDTLQAVLDKYKEKLNIV